MQIFLNGIAHDCADGTTLGQLMADVGYGQRRVAVEVNREIVARSSHATTRLCPSDQVEIVHAIGGG